MNAHTTSPELWLVRHGETEWSHAGRHTGRTDIPLTQRGREQAERLGTMLEGRTFSLVLTSPLERAHETCRIAGLAGGATVSADLMEWDYGAYEGQTTAELRKKVPGWDVWTSEPSGGEGLSGVGARADAAIALAVSAVGPVVLFAHGHLLRILAARWLELEPLHGQSFELATASVSILGYERERRVIRRWNDVSHLR
jgi:broad specificity phosphatase PhoE